MSEIIVPYTTSTKDHYPVNFDIFPKFERRPFRINYDSNQKSNCENLNYDLIVKMPTPLDQNEIPVGIVSKRYVLIQHSDLIRSVIDTLMDMGFPINNEECFFQYSKYWEQFYFSINFPRKYQIDPGDGYPLDLRLVCSNSVDGRSSLTFEMNWHRLICSNGMTVFEKSEPIRMKHFGHLNMNGVQKIVKKGLDSTINEEGRYKKWLNTKVERKVVRKWVDQELKTKWGVKAAVRTFHICSRGMDVEMLSFSQGKPSEKAVRDLREVPGSVVPVENLYAVSQALSWIASQKTDFNERLAWQRMIPGMVDMLKEMN